MIRDGLTDFLTGVCDARTRYLRCVNRAAELRDRCENITSNWEAMPGGSGDPHKDATRIALAQTTREADWWKQEWARRESEVETFLNRLSSRVYRVLLQLKYVDLLQWPQIEDRLPEYGIYYSERHIHRLHGEALEEARAIWRAEQLMKDRLEENE